MQHDELSFWRAIAEDPDNDFPRLVYADWLQEMGDPKAEFVRLQCRIAELPADDPERMKLQAQENACMQANQSRWFLPLYRASDELRGTFHRGVIEEVSVKPSQFLQLADRIFQYVPTIRRLKLFNERDKMSVPAFDRLLKLPYWDRIIAIDGRLHYLSRFMFRMLIESLQLIGLRELTVAIGGSAPYELNPIIQILMDTEHLPSLKTLALYGDSLSLADGEAIVESDVFNRLESLSFQCYGIDLDCHNLLINTFEGKIKIMAYSFTY